ncbi:glycine--tRNA ligase [Candidatus Nomurabacteria bacterium]|nr:glycine--tRNA ligase [Candidatus Nomurabacteria bacterium]
MEKIVSLCKRRGFIFPGSEIYGGFAGTWDYGHFGNEILNNIKNSWWEKFVSNREDMYGIRAAILMRQEVWQATGHAEHFADPMVECEKCQHRFRIDQIEDKNNCADCGGKLGEARQFNMMFQTKVGASEDSSAISYLRPETAQGIFVNFKNIVDTHHPKIPFGIAQIGKAFRNEITPRDFIFRSREFEQMEIEYFVRENNWENAFNELKNEMHLWMSSVGIDMNKVHELEVVSEDLAHYSKRTVDFEFDYPFGRKELFGLAYRGDFDLKIHKLEYVDEENSEKITPHVIEPSFGVERALLAILLSAYTEDEMGGEVRIYLKLRPQIAPVLCAVSPLLKNKPELVSKSREVFSMLKKEFGRVAWDDNGNIGKRYRRQDEIGTPWCIVIDFDTLGENPELLDTVTIRDRDTGNQERIKISELISYIKNKLN